MAVRTIGLTGGNYDSTLTWTESAVPTAADDVVATGTSGNLTINVILQACRSIDLTNYVGTLTRALGSGVFTIGDGTAGAGNVALRFVAGMTYTDNETNNITFVSSSATQQTVTTASKTIPAMRFNGVGSSFLLTDGLTITNALTFSQGTFSTGNQAISCGSLVGTGSSARSLLFGSSAITVTGASGTPVSFATTTNLTFNAGTSTINLTDTGASAKTFAGGGLTWNNVTITTGGAGAWTFTGSNTFANLAVTGGGTKTIKFTLGTTTTLTGGESSFFSGAAGNLITLGSSTPGSAWTLSIASNKSSDYLVISDCTVSGGGKLYCGVNSTDGGNNNANVIFTAPPGPVTGPPTGTLSLLGVGK